MNASNSPFFARSSTKSAWSAQSLGLIAHVQRLVWSLNVEWSRITPGWATPLADLTLCSLGARLCRRFRDLLSGVGRSSRVAGRLGGVPSFDSSLTGDGGRFSSDRSGTLSGGSADLLGRRPARLLLRIGERGTEPTLEPPSVATDRRSLDPDASRFATPPLILALDRLRGADGMPVLLELDTPRR